VSERDCEEAAHTKVKMRKGDKKCKNKNNIKLKDYYVDYYSINNVIGYIVSSEGQPTLYLNSKFKI